MTDTNIEISNDVSTPHISDEQLDKFFESGGEEELEPSNHEPVAEETPLIEPVATPESLALKEQAENNYKAMAHEERLRRQEVQHELQESRLRMQKMEEAFQKFVNPPLPEPSFDENPLEALRVKTERIEQLTQQQQHIAQQRAMQEQQAQRQNQFLNQYHQDAAAFAQQTTDFQDAYIHLVSSRINEYKAAGYDDKQAGQLLIEDEVAIASKAYADGVNPAQRMYEIAKLRGYNKPVAVAPVAAPNPSNIEKFNELEKASLASRSLSGTGAGGKVDKGLTLETLAEMDDEEFDKNWAKLKLS